MEKIGSSSLIKPLFGWFPPGGHSSKRNDGVVVVLQHG